MVEHPDRSMRIVIPKRIERDMRGLPKQNSDHGTLCEEKSPA